jgi:DNA-binding transcriptional MerR regulator
VDITEVAQRSGVSASTLRFYEQRGLIASIGRRGLRRLFDPRILERLALIKLGRAAGLSLDEVSRMFAADGQPRIDRQLLAAKAQELDRTISELSAMRDSLRHAAAVKARSPTSVADGLTLVASSQAALDLLASPGRAPSEAEAVLDVLAGTPP